MSSVPNTQSKHVTEIDKGDTDMSDKNVPSKIGRRQLFRYAGGAAAVAAGGTIGSKWMGKTLHPLSVSTVEAAPGDADLFLGGTDGWISLPTTPTIGFFHPDNLAPAPFTTYIFGFRNITGLTPAQRIAQKNHAQHNAPLFWVKQVDPTNAKEFFVDLTNLGLAQRPDLFDAHTLHWHGFRNVIPFFDGEPTGSVSVPAGTVFRYAYRAHEPGTYMYHCHVEDVEHVQMGMTGLVFVRPLQDKYGVSSNPLFPPARNFDPVANAGSSVQGYMYNDGDGSTAFDREYSMFLSEVWAEAHWADAHIQLPEWSNYHPDFSLLNGRVYPDTIAPAAPTPAFLPDGVTPFTTAGWAAARTDYPMATDASGDLVPDAGRPDLKYQPMSSLVRCKPTERVAMRFANLGFRESAMTLSGISMNVVGKDATPMRGRDGTDTSYMTNTLSMGAGESFDVIFVAPGFQAGAVTHADAFGTYNTYMLYDRNYKRSNNLAAGGFGGQATEVRVYGPGNTLPIQSIPNT
jgi:FtsP/CotA-like multicopper oxidase with cupredoxin domain